MTPVLARPVPGWLETLSDEVWEWFKSVSDSGHPGWVDYCAEGARFKVGRRSGLGLSALALKLLHMLSLWERLSAPEQAAWIERINGFQRTWGRAAGYFEDWKVLRPSWKSAETRWAVRRAETRQALVALLGVGATPTQILPTICSSAEAVREYVHRQPWDASPWGAGSQTSHMVVSLEANASLFGQRDERDSLLPVLLAELENLRNRETGGWGGMSASPENQLNGAMKVLSGYAFLNSPFGLVEPLIDFALAVGSDSDACHHVDLLYVLHQCARFTDHRRGDIERIALQKLDEVTEYRKPDGGFSFYAAGTGTTYYGATMADGLGVSDIHGTKLFVWLLVIVADLLGWRESLRWRLPVT